MTAEQARVALDIINELGKTPAHWPKYQHLLILLGELGIHLPT